MVEGKRPLYDFRERLIMDKTSEAPPEFHCRRLWSRLFL